jgi:uncharacterized protein (DUF427 family)
VGKVRVTVAGRKVAESTRALRLEEKGYPPVYYLPRNDADMSLLVRTTHYTYCPYKGDCTYYSIPIGGSKSEYAVWTYEKPYEAVASIKEHLVLSLTGRCNRSDLLSLKGIEMPKTTPEQNKALVLEAFDTLFNKRDYAAEDRFWSPDYIQHSDHIAPGRDGLFFSSLSERNRLLQIARTSNVD